jgi:RHS repeat-associated protein
MDDLPVGLIADGKLHYVQPDHLGTPRAVIDPQRDLAVWTWDLRGEAFGSTPPNEDADGDGQRFTLDLRFPGQRYDAATGLNYNYFRDYEAGSGRYVQSDPIGLNGGVLTYAYVTASPMKLVDKYGLYGFDASCNSTQQAKIISEIVLLNNELKRGRNENQCPAGLCNRKLADDVMSFLLNDAYFYCDGSQLNGGACAGNQLRRVIFNPNYLGATDASKISDPNKGCGCFRSSLFHEATHAVRDYMTEDHVRSETRNCVGCAANVSEKGGAL